MDDIWTKKNKESGLDKGNIRSKNWTKIKREEDWTKTSKEKGFHKDTKAKRIRQRYERKRDGTKK